MARAKLKLAWIEDRKKRQATCQRKMKTLMKKAEQLTILSGSKACLTFFNRDDGKLVAWPSQEEAQSLIDRFNALSATERSMNADDPVSYMETKNKNMEKRLEHSRKVVEELEMDHLMLQIQNGRLLVDLSETETKKLMSFASKKITDLKREIETEHPNTSGNEPFLEDGKKNMETSERESSKSGGADDA